MQKKEICWNITTRCNQGCKYCHRFLNINDLCFDDNMKILNNLINDKITDITWTGGEALMYDGIEKLIEWSYKNGIKNKLITNGKILSKSDMVLLKYLDSLTLSIDSVDNEINQDLGRGKEHFPNIVTILEYIKNNDLDVKIRINTVVSKLNIDTLEKLNNFLSNYEIYAWRIFRFMPLRETAVVNQKKFDVSDSDFLEVKNKILKNSNKTEKIEFREKEDMESKYILLVANGDIILTQNGKDVKKGNALVDKISAYM